MFSAFTGVGGFEIGIERSGIAHELVGFSEIDHHANAVLRYHWPNVKNYGSVTEIIPEELPDFDLFTFGSPCQDFSIAGKRAGITGSRSGLFLSAVAILKAKLPDHFIFENVRGLLSSGGGWDYGRVQIELAQAGYSLQWQVLNAKHFSVPQNRERVFVIGTRSDLGSPGEVFFAREHGEVLATKGGRQSSDAIISRSLTATDAKMHGDGNYVEHEKEILQMSGDSANKSIPDAHRSECLQPIMPKVLEDSSPDIQETKIRRLMPVECERLMSWPDGHTAKGRKEDGTEYEVSDTQRYKMCGNGVVSEVVRAIVEVLYKGGK